MTDFVYFGCLYKILNEFLFNLLIDKYPLHVVKEVSSADEASHS